jgi:hypothetical protein
MRRLAALVLVFAGPSLAAAQAGEIIDRVLAIVAGDLIMLSDVRAAQEFSLVEPAGSGDPVRQALTQLIERALILDEVDRYVPPEPAPDAIDRALRDARARFATADAFERALHRTGLTEDRLRGMLRQNLRLQAYVAQRFAADSAERRQAMVEEWVAGLKRRADVVDLYK